MKDEAIQQLKIEVPADFIKKPPPGKYGNYIEGWYVKDMANRIFGYDQWHVEILALDFVGEYPTKNRKGEDQTKVMYKAHVQVKIDKESEVGILRNPTVRQDWGFCDGESKYPSDAHEIAIKGAVTDGFKRAMVGFGPAFGLYLYDKDKLHENHQPTAEEAAEELAKQIEAATQQAKKEDEKAKEALSRIERATAELYEHSADAKAAVLDLSIEFGVGLDADGFFPAWAELDAKLHGAALKRLGALYKLHIKQEKDNGNENA